MWSVINTWYTHRRGSAIYEVMYPLTWMTINNKRLSSQLLHQLAFKGIRYNCHMWKCQRKTVWFGSLRDLVVGVVGWGRHDFKSMIQTWSKELPKTTTNRCAADRPKNGSLRSWSPSLSKIWDTPYRTTNLLMEAIQLASIKVNAVTLQRLTNLFNLNKETPKQKLLKEWKILTMRHLVMGHGFQG